MEQSSSPWHALIDIFLEPRKAFGAARAHLSWLWVPLLLSLVLAIGFWMWYYASVDGDWLRDHMIAQATQRMEEKGQPVDQTQLDAMQKFMTPKILMFGTLAGAVFATAIIYLLQALYLFLVAKVSGDKENGFGRWFSFTSWAYFPNIVATIASFFSYAFSGTKQVAPDELAVTSLNKLLFLNLHAGDTWFSFFESIHITTLWIIGLMAFGLMVWTGRSRGKAIAVAAGPYAVIFGIWAVVNAL